MQFTIITICYNSEMTIERTIQSILAQTYTNYEYIVIDGCSKDGTLDIVQRYEPLFFGKMRWVSERDTGIYNAMNKGVRMAMGDVIAIVNSDDWLEPGALQSIREYYTFSDPMCDTIFCGGMRFHYKDGESQQILAKRDKFERSVLIYQVAGVNHPAMLVPLKVYKRIGLFDERFKISADTDFILTCYHQKIPFFFSDQIITNMADGGISNRPGYIRQLLYEKKLILQKHSRGLLYVHVYLTLLGAKLMLKRWMGQKTLRLWRRLRYSS